MKTKITNILAIVQAVASLCVLGAVKLWAPVCDSMLTLENGNQAHMKCFYSGQAAIAVAIILLITAILTLLSKQEYRKLMIVSAAGAVMLFMLFSGLIGVCANAAMRCNSTALWGKLCGGVIILCSVIGLIGGKEGQLPS